MVLTYLNKLKQELETGNALEHSYRPAFKSFIESLNDSIRAVNEPTRSAHGAPDFIFLNKNNINLILGYAETKDINVNLDTVEKTEQLKRYLGYSNLILTNYLEFRFFRNGEKFQSIEVAKLENSNITLLETNFEQLELELKSFLEGKPEEITNAKRLAEIMGGKAARIRANVIQYLQVDNEKNQELLRIYKIIQRLLIHDLEVSKFADMYAQTLVYGLFVARYYDSTPETFTRQEARDLIPASNPFLRHFFDHIAGPDFDRRLTYIVDELCEVFSVSDIQTIVHKHFNILGEFMDKDPIIHFYEDFLKEYDPALKKQMGAYYTPIPVVNYIIKSVDHVLKSEFNILEGLASTEKIDHPVIIQDKKVKLRLHKVQLLDPAVGTATFLNETIKFVHNTFKNQEGIWKSYVEKELLPRMFGFELMMAPYTIAHLKLAMTLKETGIEQFPRRLGIYLTNTLEEGFKIPDDLFSSVGLVEAISEEAKSASFVKRDTPIMVVIGNPPYSGESFNKGAYAMKLVEQYKFEPGGKEKLHERNPKWINDDYVKFIAFAQDMIEKNGEGIVAMITNHGFLDNPTFRGMRWRLSTAFSSIYLLDLHGNAKKKEVRDQTQDENVFDIQQGVSIIVAIKHKKSNKKLADIYRSDLWGKRNTKFDFLLQNSIETIKWEKINLREPMYFFLNKNLRLESEYNKGIRINDLFIINSVGIVTSRDKFVIDFNQEKLANRISDFIDGKMTNDQANLLAKQSTKFNYSKARSIGFDKNNIYLIQYRPFDNRYIYYQDYYIERSRKDIMQNYVNGDNIGFLVSKAHRDNEFRHIFATRFMSEVIYLSGTTASNAINIPLYAYPNTQTNIFDSTARIPNINIETVKKLLCNLQKYEWINDDKDKIKGDMNKISPLDIYDYVYATLFSPSYRTTYKEFLKSDYPRIPIPKDSKSFWHNVNIGEKLRRLHLLEDPDLVNFMTKYPISGTNDVEKIDYRNGSVFINQTQFFENVPIDVWEFYIGGYQPAQKWLKDRKGLSLDYDDIIHYQKMIKAIEKTTEIMREI